MSMSPDIPRTSLYTDPLITSNYTTLFRQVRPCRYMIDVFRHCMRINIPSCLSLLLYLLLVQKAAITLEGFVMLDEHFRERYLHSSNIYKCALMHASWTTEPSDEDIYTCRECLFVSTSQQQYDDHFNQGPFAHQLLTIPYTDQTITCYLILVCFEITSKATCRFCAKQFEKATSSTLFEHAKLHGHRLNFPSPLTEDTITHNPLTEDSNRKPPTEDKVARNHLILKLQPYARTLPHTCITHDITFSNPSLLYLHLNTIPHSAGVFICALCAKQDNRVHHYEGEEIGLLQLHIRNNHPSDIKCPINADCNLNITNESMLTHVLTLHHQDIPHLPLPLRNANCFQQKTQINPFFGPVTFNTKQSTHSYPGDGKIDRYVNFACYLGLRVPLELDGVDYRISQALVDGYQQGRYDNKVFKKNATHFTFITIV